MPRSRKLFLLLLCSVLLLSSCRSWTRYAGISPADMKVGLQIYMQNSYPGHSLGAEDKDGELEVSFFSKTSPLMLFLFMIFTGGIVLPLEQSHEVAVRPDGQGGSELAVEASSWWQLFYFVPWWSHDERREVRVRAKIVDQARRRQGERIKASEAIYAVLAAVREHDLEAFRGLLWSHHPNLDQAPMWFADATYWSAVRQWPAQELNVSPLPHPRSRTTTSLFGLLSNTERYSCLWVDVTLGANTHRFEVVKDAGRYTIVLPTSAEGALQR